MFVVASAPSAGRANATATSAPSPASANAIALRNELGLSTSPDVVASAAASPATTHQYNFGLPLTQAEQDDLDNRGRLQLAEGPLVAAVQSLSSVTGGIYQDQHAGGQFVVMALPQLTASQRSTITAAVPSGGSVRFENSSLSSDQREAVVRSLSASFSPGGELPGNVPRLRADFDGRNATVSAIVPDVASETVHVLVIGLTPSLQTDLKSLALKRLGGQVLAANLSIDAGSYVTPTDAVRTGRAG